MDSPLSSVMKRLLIFLAAAERVQIVSQWKKMMMLHRGKLRHAPKAKR